MKIFENVNNFKAINPAVTIGIFDGVHLGHIQILNRLKSVAAEMKGETVVVTMWPHPRLVLGKHPENIRLLSSLEEKIRLIELNGIDHLVLLPFTRDFADIPYDEFIKDYLVSGIQARSIVVGYNHHFGKDRKGGFEQLKESAVKFKFSVERLMPVIIDHKSVSSSVIRQLIAEGNVFEGNRLLGYNYAIEGRVVEGKKLGRLLGFPTANIEMIHAEKLIPLSGVYAVRVELGNKLYNGMLNIGVRPTITEQVHNLTIEVHILHFTDDIYGKSLKLQFIKRIRDEKKFGNADELIDQLKLDKLETEKIFDERNQKI